MIHKDKIVETLSEISGTAQNLITDDTALSSDLNLSPVEILDLFSKFVQDYKIQLPQDFNIDSINTVSDLFIALEELDEEL